MRTTTSLYPLLVLYIVAVKRAGCTLSPSQSITMYSNEDYDSDEMVGYEETSENMEHWQPSSQGRPKTWKVARSHHCNISCPVS